MVLHKLLKKHPLAHSGLKTNKAGKVIMNDHLKGMINPLVLMNPFHKANPVQKIFSLFKKKH